MRVFLSGGHGLLGKSLRKAWDIYRPEDEVLAPSRTQLELTDSDAVDRAFKEFRPQLVVHMAAEVGGIQARLEHPSQYLLNNLAIDQTIIAAARRNGVGDFVYIGSAAMYPEHASQPIPETALFTGAFEAASEGYGLAKSVGVVTIELLAREFNLNYRALIPSNLYGNEPIEASTSAHLVSAALAKVKAAIDHGSSIVEIWGDGKSRREMLFADDLATWLVKHIESINRWPTRMNVGFGEDFSVAQYYEWAAEALGYTGTFSYDASKPNGVRARLLDSTVARSQGWNPGTTPRDGMKQLALESYENKP